MHKSTQAEYKERVTKVFDLLILGLTRADILQYAAKTWDIKSRMIDAYIAEAKEEIEQRAAFSRDYEMGQARERMNYIYKRCVADKNWRGALAVQREFNTLYGLYPAEKLDVTSGGEPIQLTVVYAKDK